MPGVGKKISGPLAPDPGHLTVEFKKPGSDFPLRQGYGGQAGADSGSIPVHVPVLVHVNGS